MEILRASQIIPHVANTYTIPQINIAMKSALQAASAHGEKYYSLHCSWEGFQNLTL